MSEGDCYFQRGRWLESRASYWCWYESGTGFLERFWKARIEWHRGLVAPIHHRGDGEAAGEWGGL
nr:MAG TPA: hypothetical protein [Caudoviricetes sp.]